MKRNLPFWLLIAASFGIVVSLVGEAATAPYPRSPIITGVNFQWSTLKSGAQGSDNWPITWAADDHQYTSWGDGGGFGGSNSDGRVSLGVARVEGTRDSHRGVNRWGGKNAEHKAQFGGKSYGIISIGGVLYMWVSPGSGTNNFRYVQMARSTDRGARWTLSSWKFTQSQSLMVPTILQFGKDYSGAPDSYVYHYFIHPSSTSGLVIQKPGMIYLARVPKSQMMTQSAYQFFSGFDSSRNPKWSNSVSSKVPVFQDRNNGVGWTVSVSYNRGLGRYLLTTEHTKSYPGGGNIGIFDAPTPWGPWTTAYFATPWQGPTEKCFYWNFSNKWLSSDGKSFVLVFTGRDRWNTVKGTFSVSSGSRLTSSSIGRDPDPTTANEAARGDEPNAGAGRSARASASVSGAAAGPGALRSDQEIPAATSRTSTLGIPHFLLGPEGQDTVLKLINAEAETVEVSLKVFDDEARLLRTHAFSILPGELSVARVSEILGSATPVESVLTGHLVLDVTQPESGGRSRLLATATFIARGGQATSTVPLLHQAERDSLYLHVAQSPGEGVFTGLAVMNPNTTVASVTVQAFEENGQVTAERIVQIPPGQRIADVLDGSVLFGPGFQQIGGQLKVTSDQPVVSLMIFGDNESRFLSAVQGQVSQSEWQE